MNFLPHLFCFLFVLLVTECRAVTKTLSCSINHVITKDSVPPVSTKSSLPLELENFINEEIEFKVPIMTCQQLRRLQVNGRKKLAILDARSQKEFEVSHIMDARRVGYEDFSPEKVWFVDQSTVVVIYCRLGEKSEKIALKLKKMGFHNIHNLYGSIIEWVDQGLPVVDKEGNPTKKIHKMTAKERRLLNK